MFSRVKTGDEHTKKRKRIGQKDTQTTRATQKHGYWSYTRTHTLFCYSSNLTVKIKKQKWRRKGGRNCASPSSTRKNGLLSDMAAVNDEVFAPFFLLVFLTVRCFLPQDHSRAHKQHSYRHRNAHTCILISEQFVCFFNN